MRGRGGGEKGERKGEMRRRVEVEGGRGGERRG